MLRLQHLSLVHFKNYANRSFTFSKRVTGICGRNGAGKTNLLDAIHYLCFTRSYFSRLDAGNIKQGETGFRIEGEFSRQGKTEKAVCILRETGRKEFSINEAGYDKFSKHIGHYPCVVIAPDDASLITGTGEERRKFIDALLSQLDGEYLQQLIRYFKLLQQRNSLLRAFAESGNRDERLLDVLDEQIIVPGTFIFDSRKKFLLSFLPQVRALYALIAGREEDLQLYYESGLLQASFPELLTAGRQKDLFSQRSNFGIHRDELEARLGGQLFKNIASQGQRKSLLFALKLAEMEVLKNEKGFAPLLLLDDVFEKLDEERMGNLLEKVCLQNEGQVFITDTNAERLRAHLAAMGLAFEMLELEDGK